ncbi:hypothetical protein [Cellulomonas sp. ATA003]|uniref:hypothetical protein n=1 Tax=Cellulomonas sp. ATA003 TaxID=3073064 RepID=UPI00287305C8|nr:hypothetical protein [Cellulomonas sp. ATA003]WNB86185.1 hypothetical protein REH70_02625 [Cellulomonas sp. ATA003]
MSVDPWVAEVPNNPISDVYRFTVPAEAVTEATGIEDGLVAVHGNFGPGKAWTTLNTGTSGPNLTATIGPLEPGLYLYEYAVRPAVDQDAVAFRNPDAPQEVTSKPTLSTLFVRGPGSEWLDDVAGGGELQTLGYGKGVRRDHEALVWTPPGTTPTARSPTRSCTCCRTRVRAHASGSSSAGSARSWTTSRSTGTPSRWWSSWATAGSTTVPA